MISEILREGVTCINHGSTVVSFKNDKSWIDENDLLNHLAGSIEAPGIGHMGIHK